MIQKAYEIAVERYAAVGVDTEKVLKTMQDFHLSLHCWQADDVTGFEVQAGALSGGIQATGNYPGKARNIDELRADILKAASYIPGTHRLNLHSPLLKTALPPPVMIAVFPVKNPIKYPPFLVFIYFLTFNSL